MQKLAVTCDQCGKEIKATAAESCWVPMATYGVSMKLAAGSPRDRPTRRDLCDEACLRDWLVRHLPVAARGPHPHLDPRPQVAMTPTLPAHITGNEMLKCVCGGSMFHEHELLPAWIKQHQSCTEIIASGQRSFCKDCVHYKIEISHFSSEPYYLCTRDDGVVDSVNGKPVTLYCGGERDEGACGPAAKFFVPKPTP